MEKRIEAAYQSAPKTWIWKLLLAFLVAGLMAWSSSTVTFTTAGSGLEVAGNILSGIFHPGTKLLFNFTTSGVAYLLLETLCIAFLGTIVGAVISVPFSTVAILLIIKIQGAFSALTRSMSSRSGPPTLGMGSTSRSTASTSATLFFTTSTM